MLSFKNKNTPYSSPHSDGYDSDEPTPFQRAEYAEIQSQIDARRKLGVVDGRDWAGNWVAPHPQNCQCNHCSPLPNTCPLFRMACPTATAAEEKRFTEQARLFAHGSWWSLFGNQLMAAEAAEALEYAKTRPEREKASAASVAAYNQKIIEEKVAVEARRNLKRGEQVEKNGRLCTRLYSCVGDKASGGARPTTMHVSSECWSHERVDPVSGKLLAPHKCPFLHPGEPGWHAEWTMNRLWKPAAAPTRSWEAENRFAAAAKPHNGGWEKQDRRR